MPSEDVFKARDFSKTIAFRIKQERERRAWTQAEVAERVGSTRINVNRWENGVTLPSLYYRRRLAELFEKSLQELGFVSERNEQNNEEVPYDTPQYSSLLWNVPHRRNPYFTGRMEILQQLRAEFESSHLSKTPIALKGLGGIGKTQTAMEYAYHYRNAYQAVFWLNASTHDTLSSNILTLASLLNLAQNQEQEEVIVQAIKHWLMTHSNWLLILDNISSIEIVNELLPLYTLGDVLLTTRMQAVGTLAHSIAVEDMTQEEGVLFLLRRTKRLAPHDSSTAHKDREAASKIVKELGGLPLALDQAGAYIEETHCGFAQYLHHYLSHQQELLQRRGTFPIHHPDPVATTWQLSFRQIEDRWSSSKDLLHLCAFLDSDSIPEELLVLGAPELGPVLADALKDPLRLDSVLEPLHLYSLIHRSSDTASLTVHRLVQTVLRQDLSFALQKQWAQRALCALNSIFPDPRRDNTTWPQCQRLLSQALACVYLFEKYELFIPEAESLFERVGDYAFLRANFERAKNLNQKTLRIRERAYGEEHFATARGLSRLGEVYRALGEYTNAESLFLRAYAIYECSSLSEDLLEFADTLNDLGQLYHNVGRYKEAEKCFHHALSITERVGGPNHVDTLTTLHHMAKLYHSEQQIEKAEEIYHRVLAAQEQLLGTEHYQIAVILNNLAILYRSQANYERAEALLLRVLRMEEVFGSDHPQIGTAMHNLGVIYRKQKLYEKAEKMFQRALAIKETSRGSKHPSTIVTMTNLAHLYQKQKRYQEAQALLQQAVGANLGLEHPYTIVVFRNLARLYHEEENYEEAEKHYLHALEICEQIFPVSYADMKIILKSLAELYKAMQREEEIAAIEQRLVTLDERLL